MTMATHEVMYLAAGLLLPMFYAPQIKKLWSDNTLLHSYSLTKASTQLALRIFAIPIAFININYWPFTFAVLLDVTGRAAELGVALHSLRRQKNQSLTFHQEVN